MSHTHRTRREIYFLPFHHLPHSRFTNENAQRGMDLNDDDDDY
jgi:hypothetical protein